jgi:hypothetical protein
LLKSMFDKHFKEVIVELSFLSIYLLLSVFLWGFHKGASIRNKSGSNKKKIT